MADTKILNNNESDFSDESDYDSNDEGYIDLVRTGPSAIHGSKTKPYETGVSLGFIDCEEDGDLNIFDSRLGGRPLWLSSKGHAVPTCGNCKRKLALLVQIYAPLEGTEYDRCLYVFICKQAGCKRAKGSVRALRGVKRDLAAERKAAAERKQKEQEEAEKKKRAEETSKSVGANLFGGNNNDGTAATANPFGGSSNPFAAASNPFAAAVEAKPKAAPAPAPSGPTFADIVKETIPENPKTAVTPMADESKTTFDSKDVPAFEDAYFLCVEAEVLDPLFNKRSLPAGLNPQDLLNLKLDTTPDEADAEGSGSIDARAAELAAQIPGADDPAFQKFVDTVSQNPTQIVRYDRQGGAALMYSSRDAVAKTLASNSIPVHPVTREPRQVELQIMPHAITVLEEDELKRAGSDDANDVKKRIEDGMEWGTIFVATPLVDELELDEDGVGYSEEWVGVQYEQF
jgi:pre-rRNA-processing protein TSR4